LIDREVQGYSETARRGDGKSFQMEIRFPLERTSQKWWGIQVVPKTDLQLALIGFLEPEKNYLQPVLMEVFESEWLDFLLVRFLEGVRECLVAQLE
jgi:hypothetical protein